MSVFTEVAPVDRERTGWLERTAVVAADALAWAPVAGAGRLAQFFYSRRDSAVWIIILVALAVVVAIGFLAWAYAYCLDRGGNFDGGLSWRFPNPITAELRFKCTR